METWTFRELFFLKKTTIVSFPSTSIWSGLKSLYNFNCNCLSSGLCFNIIHLFIEGNLWNRLFFFLIKKRIYQGATSFARNPFMSKTSWIVSLGDNEKRVSRISHLLLKCNIQNPRCWLTQGQPVAPCRAAQWGQHVAVLLLVPAPASDQSKCPWLPKCVAEWFH